MANKLEKTVWEKIKKGQLVLNEVSCKTGFGRNKLWEILKNAFVKRREKSLKEESIKEKKKSLKEVSINSPMMKKKKISNRETCC